MVKKLSVAVALFATAVMSIPPAQAQVNGNKVDVVISANVLETLSIVIAVPTVAFGTVSAGTTNTAPLGQAVSIVTAWNLASGRAVKLYAYFDSSTTALTGLINGNLIPVSAVKGSVNGGSSAAFNSTSPFTSGATALQVYSATVTNATLLNTRTDSLALTLDLTSVTLSNDTYTGTMHVQAQAV